MPDVVERLADRLVDTGWPGDRDSAIRYTKAVLADVEAVGLVIVDPAEITELRRILKSRAEDYEALRRELADREDELRVMEGDLQRAESFIAHMSTEETY